MMGYLIILVKTMHIETNSLKIDGCFSAKLTSFKDDRGTFQKLFQSEVFKTFLPSFKPKEIYLTSSSKNVLRGMHFHLPPDDHEKIVICLSGRIQDVLLDLRKGKNFGKSTYEILSPDGPNMMIIPKGIAHGFFSFEQNSNLLYMVGSEYNPKSDAGIHWNSFNFEWPTGKKIISNRDTNLQDLSNFKVPSQWENTYV